MDRALKARIGTARLLLQEHSSGPSHKAVSAIQMAAILDMVSTQKLTNIDKSAVCEMVLEVNWYEGHLDKLLGELAEDADEPRRAKRRQLQDFMAIAMYGSRQFWDRMMAESTGKDEKLSLLIGLCISLGLRLPSEPTFKLLCSLWMFMSESREQLMNFSQQQKTVLLFHVKSEFMRAKRQSPEPHMWVSVLPLSPAAFQREFNTLYAARFAAGSDPIPVPFDTRALHELNSTYTCRGGSAKKQTNINVGCTSGSERLLETLLDRVLPAIAKVPQPLITYVDRPPVGGNAVASLAGKRNLGSMACFAGQSLQKQLSMESVADDASFGSQIVPRVPEDEGAAELALVLSTPAAVPRIFPSAPEPAVLESNSGGVARLLSMLHSRDVDKKEEKRAARKRPAAAALTGGDEDDLEGDDEDVAESDAFATSKGEGNGTGKKKAARTTKSSVPIETAREEASGEAADEVCTGEAGVTSKGNGKGKRQAVHKAKAAAFAETAVEEESGAAVGEVGAGKAGATRKGEGKEKHNKAAGKAKPSASADTAMKYAFGIQLGCSKCRGLPRGCGQCRNPSFTGKRFQRTT